MLNNNQAVTVNQDDNPPNIIQCRYCSKDMVQIVRGYVPSFVCLSCGGSCVIRVEEKTIWKGAEGTTEVRAKEIRWSKVPIKDKLTKKK